jgi:hypothetical protein
MMVKRTDPAEGQKYLRYFYKGWRPTRAGRIVNGAWAWLAGMGLTPSILLTLQVKGRTSGQLRTNVLVPVKVDGKRYLVSMLGEKSEWVRNIRAADGAAFIKRLRRRPIHLAEVLIAERSPILKEYCRVATSGRKHFPVPKDASLEAFAAIAGDYPVFRIDPA